MNIILLEHETPLRLLSLQWEVFYNCCYMIVQIVQKERGRESVFDFMTFGLMGLKFNQFEVNQKPVLEILFFWLGAQDSQFFLAPKARKSRHFLHRDKSA